MILPRNLLSFLHKKNWKREFKLESYCKRNIFSLKKSHVTKRHNDIIKIFWKKHKTSPSAKNIYGTTANIKTSGKDGSIKKHQKAEPRIEINEKHPKLIQDLVRTPEK